MGKKSLAAILTAGTIVIFCACSNDSSKTATNDTATVVIVDSSEVSTTTQESMLSPVNAMVTKMKAMKMTGVDHDYAQ